MATKSSVDSVCRDVITDMKILLLNKEEPIAMARMIWDMVEKIRVLEQGSSKIHLVTPEVAQ